MLKKLKNRFKRFKNYLLDTFHPVSIRARSAYELARKKADALSEKTKERVYVLCDDDGKLIVVDKSAFFRFCRKKKLPSKITIKNLHTNSLYYTGGQYYKGATLYHHKPMKPLLVKRKLHHYKRFMRSIS